MTKFAWESDVAEEAQAEPRPPGQPLPPEQEPQEPVAEPGSLAMSANEFSALEERILRAVNVVKRERLARAEAVERAALADAQLREQATQVEQLQKEVNALRAERDLVRQRVERLLAQLDALEL
jgi:FtsZ-binding cell division protein ZapB